MMKHAASFRFRAGITLIACLAFVSCQGPQGLPTEKQHISLALEQYYQAEKLHRKGQLEAARDLYRASLESSPRPRVYFRLAQVQSELGEYEDALKSCDLAMKLSHDFQQAEILKRQIETGLSSGAIRTTSASSPSEKISPQRPTVVQVPIQGKPADAVDSSETKTVTDSSQVNKIETVNLENPISLESSSSTPKEINSKLSEARKTAKEGNWDQALALCEEVLKSDPNNADTHHTYGFICFHLDGKLADAETAFRRSIELNPKFADAYNDLGVTLERMNQPAKAIKAYEKAVDIGNNPDAFYNLALMREKLGEYRKAISLYEQYLKFDQTGPYGKTAENRIKILQRNEY